MPRPALRQWNLGSQEPLSLACLTAVNSKKQPTKCIEAHASKDATDVAISPSGRHAVWLFTHTLRFFEIDFEKRSVHETSQPLKLNTAVEWDHVAISGNYIATWGHREAPMSHTVGRQYRDLNGAQVDYRT